MVPRGLVGFTPGIVDASITSDGLCPISLKLEDGLISDIQILQNQAKPLSKLVLPRLVEVHAHIDKAFTWSNFPNLDGTYQGALEANFSQHQIRTVDEVLSRAERSIYIGLKNGIRAMRTHIDSFSLDANQIWEGLIELRKKWKASIELEFVALAPLDYWGTNQGKVFGKMVAVQGGLLGGVIVPPFNRKVTLESLGVMVGLANDLGCGIDLHIDETDQEPAAGLKLLLQVLDKENIQIPITCSHLSSLGLLPHSFLMGLAERLAKHQVNVIALPLTNGWLLNHDRRITPIQRPLAPIHQLQLAGVNVAIGSDNVQDSWFPIGNLDPLSLIAFTMPLAQLAPWQRLGLSPFTTSSARVMKLQWDGVFRKGSPADLVLLDVSSWSQALSVLPNRKVMINGEWFKEKIIPTEKSNEIPK